jgi:predicted RNA-binding Zn ribbon-like protein
MVTGTSPPAGTRPFLFVGERPCLDFVNTTFVDGAATVDLLHGFDALVDWCEEAKVVSATEARHVRRRWSGSAEAASTHVRALAFRGALRGMLERLADGRSVPQAALDAINDLLGLDAGQREVVRTRDGYETRQRRTLDTPDQLLGPIAASAAQLVSGDDLSLVKACQNPQCVLLFYDTTKNHARRWCSMAACGNRAKVAAHYQRARRPAPGKTAG